MVGSNEKRSKKPTRCKKIPFHYGDSLWRIASLAIIVSAEAFHHFGNGRDGGCGQGSGGAPGDLLTAGTHFRCLTELKPGPTRVILRMGGRRIFFVTGGFNGSSAATS